MSGYQNDDIAGSSLELIVGPYRSGKTDRSLIDLIEYCQVNPFKPCLIVVPSSRHQNLLAKRLAELLKMQSESSASACGILGLHIVPFYRACDLAVSASGTTARVIPDAVRPQIMAKVLENLRKGGKLNQLARIASYPGTHAALLELMDALARTGFSPSQLSIKVKTLASQHSRIVELAKIYEAYNETMGRHGFLDKRQLAFTARELLYADKVSGLSYGRLIVDGFDRLSPLQIGVIGGLSRLAEKTDIIFDFDPSCLNGSEDSQTFESPSEAKQEYEWKQSSYEQAISLLSPRVIETKARPKKAPPKTELFSALDTFEEMHEIARRCKVSLSSGNCMPNDILVTARNLSAYRSAIEAAFDGAGIPYFVDRSINLIELPLAQFVKTLLTVSANNFPRAQVISLLRSRYFAGAAYEINREDIEELDKLSRKVELVAGKSLWLQLSKTRLSANFQKPFAKILSLLTPPASKHPLSFFCRWFEDLLDDLFLIEDEDDDLALIQKEKQALSLLRSLICDLIQEENVLGPEQLTYEDFSGRFLHLMEKANFREQAALNQYVTICDAELVPARRFEEVYLCGLNEGVFPARSRPPLFLSAEEIALWSDFGVHIDNPRSSASFEYALYKSLGDRAYSKLSLSFRTRDASNEELLPSFFISEGKSTEELAIPHVDTWHNSLQAPYSLNDAFAARLWHNQATASLAQGQEESQAAALHDTLSFLLSSSKSRSGQESLFNGYLSALVQARALSINLPESFSASGLSDYGKCPFRYFVSSALKLSPHQEPEAGLDIRQRGTEFHNALEEFYKRLCTDELKLNDLSQEDLEHRLDAVLAQLFAQIEARTYFFPGPFWLYEKHEMRFRLKRFLQREKERQALDANQLPAIFEAKFGYADEDSYPALVIKSDNGEIFLRGKIDRIDLPGGHIPEDAGAGTYASVIDYKSGVSQISAKEAESGRNLQLPIYALALKNSILPNAQLFKAFYLSIGSGDVIGKFDFTDPKALAVLDQAEEHVRAFTKSIAGGDFRVAPSDPKVCLSCDHKTICRVKELDRALEEEDDG